MSDQDVLPFSVLFGVSRENADLVGIAVAACRSGYAVLPVYPNSKRPACTLTPTARTRADKAASAAAKEAGHRGWQNVRHSNSGECGLKHAITNPDEARRVFKRMVEDWPELNIALEVGRSRMVCVDADNAEDVTAFTKFWAEESGYSELQYVKPTVTSPGVVRVDSDGVAQDIHKGGGHFWFRLPDGVDFDHATTSTGLTLPREDGTPGAVVYFRDRVLLVPPSVREEGPYVLNSEAGSAPEWLVKLVTEHVVKHGERRKIQRDKIITGTDPIDVWSADTPWAELLEPDGWTASHKFDSCQCEIWTRPGDWSSPKSATAHELGCTQWDLGDGAGFLHIWTDNPGVDHVERFVSTTGGKSLSKLQYVAWRDFDGEYSAAMGSLGLHEARLDVRSLLPPGEQDGDGPWLADTRIDAPEAETDELWPVLDWPTAFAEQPDEIPWLVEPMFERGRYYSVFSREKVGKSLLLLEIVASLSAGRAVLNSPPGEKVTVLYIDFENTTEDIVERLQDMDFGPDDLEKLRYMQFPAMGYMDTDAGARDLAQMCLRHKPDIVVIDTTSRVISGDENDSGPFLALYTRCIVPLKRAGITVIRLDHSGKDETRGQRGSSAKATAEDVVWELATKETGSMEFTLKKTRTRNNHGPMEVRLTRRIDPLRHEMVELDPNDLIDMEDLDDAVARVMVLLDGLGIPASWGERKVRKALKEAGQETGNSALLRKAIQARKRRAEGV